MPGFPAARQTDTINHDLLTPSGVIGPPYAGPCPQGPVLIEGLPAAHIFCSTICSGMTAAGPAHPPPSPPQNQIVSGSATVHIHGQPATRWSPPSLDAAACTAFFGISTLAPMRTVLIGGPTLVSTLAMARSLIQLGGTADVNDGELVAQELSQFPPHMLQNMIDGGTRVTACRGSITEHRTDLRGVTPRGWDPGDTWDDVPGVFDGNRNEVVIATVGHGTSAGAHVPQTGESHGSHNVVLHEAAHAVDHNASADDNSQSADFNAARNADSGTLSDYESQPGSAGQEETYAESAARYYGGDPDDAADHPNLHNHWASDPLGPSP